MGEHPVGPYDGIAAEIAHDDVMTIRVVFVFIHTARRRDIKMISSLDVEDLVTQPKDLIQLGLGTRKSHAKGAPSLLPVRKVFRAFGVALILLGGVHVSDLVWLGGWIRILYASTEISMYPSCPVVGSVEPKSSPGFSGLFAANRGEAGIRGGPRASQAPQFRAPGTGKAGFQASC